MNNIPRVFEFHRAVARLGRGISKYPIGATWKGKEINPIYREGIIWLEERHKYHEFWRWSWTYPDGSAPAYASDWGTSYRMCRNMMNLNCRMKRVV